VTPIDHDGNAIASHAHGDVASIVGYSDNFTTQENAVALYDFPHGHEAPPVFLRASSIRPRRGAIRLSGSIVFVGSHIVLQRICEIAAMLPQNHDVPYLVA
jgi:hypothetical protein